MKINLTVFAKLVEEFNKQIEIANLMGEIQGQPKENLVAEYSKCMGLASSISYEAAALVGDIGKEVKANSNPNINEHTLEDLFPTLQTSKSIKN